MKFYPLIIGLIASFELYGQQKGAADLSLMYEYAPPFAYIQNGQAQGIYVQEMQTLFAQANINVTHEVYPFVRAITKLKSHSNSLLFSMAKNPDRAPLFIWIGALDSLCPSLLKLKQRTEIQIRHKQDVQNYRIALVREDFISGQLIQEKWLDTDKVLWVADLAQAYQLLANNKVELMAADLFHMQLLAKQSKQTHKHLSSAYALKQHRRKLYLAANPKLDPKLKKRLLQATQQRHKILSKQKSSKLRLKCNA